MTDASGAVTFSARYEPYGAPLIDTQTDPSAFKYIGQVRDEQTGLSCFGVRFYDAEVGRFLCEDPVLGSLASPLTMNRYSYCVNNPISYCDPSGMKPAPALQLLYCYKEYESRKYDTDYNLELEGENGFDVLAEGVNEGALGVLMSFLSVVPGANIVSGVYFVKRGIDTGDPLMIVSGLASFVPLGLLGGVGAGFGEGMNVVKSVVRDGSAILKGAGRSILTTAEKSAGKAMGAFKTTSEYFGAGIKQFESTGAGQWLMGKGSSIDKSLWANSVQYPDAWDAAIRTVTTGLLSMRISEFMSGFLPDPPPFGPPTFYP